jgi:hypothetical protein
MTNHPNRNTKVELEIVGGAMARYLAKFSKRHFSSFEAAGKYMDRVATYLDEMGVRAAHPMTAYNSAGLDITAECWAAFEAWYANDLR